MSAKTDAKTENSTLPAGSGKIIFILALGQMFAMMNVGSFGAFMPAISRDLDVSIPMLGQITGMIFFGAAGISLLAGPLADKYGKRHILVIGLSAIVVSTFFTMLAPSYGWLLAARLISAISAGMVAGTTLATAGTLFDGAARRQAMSWIGSGVAAGPIVGIPVLTLIASFTSWRISYGVLCLAALIWIFLLRRIVPNDGRSPDRRIDIADIVNAYRPLLGDRSMLRLYGSTLTRAICWVGVLTYVGAYLGNELGFSTRNIGWAYVAGGGGYFIGTKLAGTRVGDMDLHVLYGAMTLAMGVFISLAITLPVGAPGAVGLLAIGALAGGLGFVGLITLVSSTSSGGQGTTMSLNAAMFTLGSSLGGFLGAALLATGGYAALGLGLFGFSLISTALAWPPWLVVRRLMPRQAAID